MALTPEEAKELASLRSELGQGQNNGLTPEEAEELKSLRAELAPYDNQPDKSMTRGFARGARDVASGVLDTADLIASPVRSALNAGASALGYGQPFNPMGEAIAQGIDTATEGYTAPKDDTEKTQEAIVRGLSSMPVGGVIGSGLKAMKYAPKAAQAAGNFLQQSNIINPANIAGTAATTGLTQQHLNQNPGDVGGAIAAGLLGGTAAQGLTKGISNIAKNRSLTPSSEALARNVGKKLGINPNKVEDFQKIGVTPTVADVSDKKSIKMMTHALEHIPFAETPITEAKNLQRQQVLKLLGQNEPTDILTRHEAGKLTTKGAKAYHKAASKTHAQQFGQIKSDLEKMPDKLVEPKNIMKHFSEQLAENSSDPDLIKDYLKSHEGKFLSSIEQVAKRHKGNIPYEYLKRTLSNINNKVTTHGLIGKVDQGELKNIASIIDKDIEHSMAPRFKTLGKESYQNWVDARKNYHGFAQEDIPKLNEIYKKDKKGAVDTFTDLITNQKRDASKVKMVLKELAPSERKQLTDAVQKKLGATSDGSFSILKWNREFKGLDSEAQNILLSSLDKHNQKRVLELTDVIDHFRSTLNEANTSGSGYYNTLSKIAAGIFGTTASLYSGDIMPAVKLLGGMVVARIGSEALTSPKLINWVHKGMRIKSISQLERHMESLNHVKGISKNVVREVQMLQHDLENANKKD